MGCGLTVSAASITPAQAKYIAVLTDKLGYPSPREMWKEYGFTESTPFGDKARFVSKAAASNIIERLKARIADAP